MQSYDIYELMIIPPNKKGEMLIDEIRKHEPNLNLVGDLIVLGANLYWFRTDGTTALHMCAYKNHPEILRMLLDAGADLNVQDGDGRTALYMCAIIYNPEIAEMLLDAEADVNIQDNDGSTALHVSAYWNHSRIAKMLIDAGADMNMRNNDGKLPYELARTQELKELLKL
jgi:hypothetical protein